MPEKTKPALVGCKT